MDRVRACPICPGCGSKKFDRVASEDVVVVRCTVCGKEITI